MPLPSSNLRLSNSEMTRTLNRFPEMPTGCMITNISYNGMLARYRVDWSRGHIGGSFHMETLDPREIIGRINREAYMLPRDNDEDFIAPANSLMLEYQSLKHQWNNRPPLEREGLKQQMEDIVMQVIDEGLVL